MSKINIIFVSCEQMDCKGEKPSLPKVKFKWLVPKSSLETFLQIVDTHKTLYGSTKS